ncbi:THAP9 [Mytilus coruscus]|uniref:THAP9 n=1 Tax=Mytilus coruscus TaxID=42192 RepID=A0A6J8DIP0_MYTCO|nr:THAP9 [Mytilus coruscus]
MHQYMEHPLDHKRYYQIKDWKKFRFKKIHKKQLKREHKNYLSNLLEINKRKEISSCLRKESQNSRNHKNSVVSVVSTLHVDWTNERGQNIQSSTKNQIQSVFTGKNKYTDTYTDTNFWPIIELIELGDLSSVQSPAFLNEHDETNEKIEHYVVLDKVYQYDPNNSLEEFVTTKREEQYSALKRSCQKLVEDTLYAQVEFMRSAEIIRYVSVYDSDNPGRLSDQHDLWHTLPGEFVTIQQVECLLNVLLKYDVCIGNPDEELQKLCSGKMAYVETGYGNYRGDCAYKSTIRTISCMLLTDRWKPRCKNCITYGKTVKKQAARRKLKTPTPSKNWLTSKKGNSLLNDSKKVEKIKQLKNYNSNLESQFAALKKKVENSIRSEGVSLSENNSKDMVNLMTSCENIVSEQFPDENCFQRLFWSQQAKFNNLADKRVMRWHSMLIKWCIYLKSKSTSTYDSLRHSGFIKLPSERLLYDYTHVIKQGVGFKAELIDMLTEEMEAKGATEEWQQYVGLLQDEIKVKSELVYDKHCGELIGFIDLDSMSNSPIHMEECIKEEAKKLATHILVVMVRGISVDLKFPLAHFATNGITLDQLFGIFWECVELVEIDAGLKVLYITADGASPNRRFIKLHITDDQQTTVYRAINRLAADERYIYFVSDPPHLIQTARNCFSN